MKTLLRSFFLLIIFIIGSVAFLLTPTGLRSTIAISTHFLPGKLHIRKISGVIIGPITLNDVHYQDSKQTITIQKLQLNWRPVALFKKIADITTLHVDGLTVITHSTVLSHRWDAEKVKSSFTELVNAFQEQSAQRPLRIHSAVFENTRFIDPLDANNNITIKKLALRLMMGEKKSDIQLQTTLEKPALFQIEFSLLGTPDQYQVSTRIVGPSTNWVLTGSGSRNGITLHSTAHHVFLRGIVDVDYQMQLQPNAVWQGRCQASDVNLSLFNPEFVHALSLQINSEGNNNGTLTTKSSIRAHTPHGDLHADIEHKNTWHITWHLTTTTLSHWIAVTDGKFSSRGHVFGDLNNPDFDLEFKGALKTNELTVRHATITIAGTFKKHTILADIDAKHQHLRLSATGQYNHNEWQGLLNQFSFAVKNNTNWVLTKNTKITASEKKVAFNSLCLSAASAGNVCMQGQWTPEKILGNLQLHIVHFDWLRTWFPILHMPSGTLQGNLALQGTLKKPILTGDVKLAHGSVQFQHYHITLNNISAALITHDHQMDVKITAYSKNQPIQLIGSIDLSQPVFSASATLKTNNALVLDSEEYTVYATSDLTANIKGNHIVIGGTLTIPTATIHPADFQSTVTLPERDIVYVGGPSHPPKSFWDVQSNVLVNLGKQVVVHASGVTAHLTGSLHIMQHALTESVFATGQIFVRNGIYTVYGQTLTISPDSYLSYSDTLINNPTLNITASKPIKTLSGQLSNYMRDNLVVGVEIHGTYKKIKITFFSNNTSLSQADILSYIFLGYGTSSKTPTNTDFLLRALSAANITSEGLMGKQNIAAQIQQGLGLSELGVESETTVDALGNPLDEQSAFVVGKNITRKLYVRYSRTLMDPVNVFQLRYLLNDRWAVQTDSSVMDNGADVLYTIQKN